MNDINKQFKQITDTASKLGKFFASNSSFSLDELKNNEELDKFIDLVAEINKSGQFREYRIGMIREDASIFSLGSLVPGKFILYKDERDGTFTVQQPYSFQAIVQEKSKGSNLCSHTIINVPKYLIKKI